MRWLTFALVTFLASDTAATTAKVGIDEKLGATIPAAEITFNDEQGNPLQLASLLDQPLALSLVFFRCAGICTPLLNGVAKVTDAGSLKPGRDFRHVSVSFDTRDTPELARIKKQNQLQRMKRNPVTDDGWRFLTGDQANIDKLTRAVGFNYTRSEDGAGFNHAGAVIFISKTGKIVRYLHGTKFNPIDLRMAVEDASAGHPRPLIRKVAQLCFAYDPVGRGYVLKVNRIILAVTLLFAAGFGGFLLLRRRRAPVRRHEAVGADSNHVTSALVHGIKPGEQS